MNPQETNPLGLTPAPEPSDAAPFDPGLSARSVALDMVAGVLRRGRAMDDEPPGLNDLTARDRAFARAMVAATLRRLGQIDALIGACLERPIPPRDGLAHDVLRIAVAQLLFLGTPAHAAVGTAVALVRARGRPRYDGLANAVLRRLARDGTAMMAEQDKERINTPDWLWQAWEAAYDAATARAISRAHLNEPPLDISVKAEPERWAKLLGAVLMPTGTLRRPTGGAIAKLPGFGEGAWWVQDAAAALPARLLGDVRGKTVIDLCSAPGGKTMQLAAAGANVISVDISANRLARVRENLERTQLSAELVEADATAWRPNEPAQLVLLDAPCTATGTIRRHPDIPHLKGPGDVAKLAALQERLLANAVAMLAPRGILVYAVCSLEPPEGIERIEALLKREPSLRRRPLLTNELAVPREALVKSGDLRTLPSHWAEQGGMDGFYAARLIKRA